MFHTRTPLAFVASSMAWMMGLPRPAGYAPSGVIVRVSVFGTRSSGETYWTEAVYGWLLIQDPESGHMAGSCAVKVASGSVPQPQRLVASPNVTFVWG